jgi:type IV pilus assembly protein PilX
MNTYEKSRCRCFVPAQRQRGVSLFIALISLATLMLGAVALVRSVDTSALISGNLAFKQAATTAGDAGLQQAITWMLAKNNANVGLDAAVTMANTFNQDDAMNGYFSNLDPNKDLKAASTWGVGFSYPPAGTTLTDANGNIIRFIVQRMCKNPNALGNQANCVFSNGDTDQDSHIVRQRPDKPGQSVLNRVTVQITGPRSTVSYIQAIIY